MPTDWLQVLPNLSIGVISVIALAYISLRHSQTQQSLQDQFITSLDDRADKHEAAMNEREQALRAVEADVRRNLTDQLAQNTIALKGNADAFASNTKLMERFVEHLDSK